MESIFQIKAWSWIFCYLALEHLNRLTKIVIRNLGSKGLDRAAIDRYCKSLATNKQLLDNFGTMYNISLRYSNHVPRSVEGDLRKILNEIIQHKAFH